MARTRESVAPWAEPVPGVPCPMSLDEFERLPDDEKGYELVEGRLVRVAPPGGGHGSSTMNLAAPLSLHVKVHRLGQVVAAETGFILSLAGNPRPTELAPDIAFVRAARLPPRDTAAWDAPWRLAPDLVVEVASPTQTRAELAAKARFWLARGVRLLWLVWPRLREIDVWQPGFDHPVRALKLGDVLDGLDVVPGFVLPLAELFA